MSFRNKTIAFVTTMAVAVAGGTTANHAGVGDSWLLGVLVAVLVLGWSGLPTEMLRIVRSTALGFAGIIAARSQ